MPSAPWETTSWGHEILGELDNNSIRYLIEKVPYPTGTVQVTLQNGVPDYIINERVAWDHLSPTSNAIDLAERRMPFASVL